MPVLVLPPERVVELQDSMRILSDLVGELQNAKTCGFDCQSRIDRAKVLIDRAQLLIQHYGNVPWQQTGRPQ